MVDLASNQLPVPPPQPVIDAATAALLTPNTYPEREAETLRAAIAGQRQIDVSQVAVGAGSATVLEVLIRAHALRTVTDPHGAPSPPQVIFAGPPTFAEYHQRPQFAGAEAVAVPLRNGRQDLDALAERATAAGDAIVIVTNPHNPTGDVVHTAELLRFLDTVPPSVLVVVDEAYRPFASTLNAPSALQMGCGHYQRLGHRPNVAILSTFSKAHGIGGLRVGYLIAHPDVAERVRRTPVPFPVNSAGLSAATAALAPAVAMAYNEIWTQVRTARGVLRDALLNLGFTVPISHGNFLWLPEPEDSWSARFGDHCTKHRIRVHPMPGHGVRVSVGSSDHNLQFLEAAGAFLTH